MSGDNAKTTGPTTRRRRWGRFWRDTLLLPPALLYVIVEQVFWSGAKRLLRQASRLPAVKNLQERLARLPPAVVLPLFLVPEIFSHIGGFWATALLGHRKWLAAMLVGLFVKGTATLLEVWIYQICEDTLLSVKWFAWAHRQVMRGRDWVRASTRPARHFARRLAGFGRSGLASRFGALRAALARRLGLARK